MTQYHTIKRQLIANRGEDHPSADQRPSLPSASANEEQK